MENDIVNNIWPDWKTVRQIGKGSFGVVYEAVRTDPLVESHAAVKVISIPQNESEIASLRSEGLSKDATKIYLQGVVRDFIGEIQLMESLKGVQNIVSVEDYKVTEKPNGIGWNIYIRMELLTPLNSYICNKNLTEKEIIKLGVDICAALELCAKRHVIHRDVKPENIFINSFGDFKLGDFGIARKLENVTGGLSRKGTYSYMAPEVERGSSYDSTVDLYSLGLALYRFMNRNRLPFLETQRQLLSPNEHAAAARRRMNGEPLPVPCDASPAMAQVILCACAYDPGRRFSSAAAMKNALLNAAKNPSNKSAPVYPAPQIQNLNRSASAQAGNTVHTFGKKKKSKAPFIIAAVFAAFLAAGSGAFLALGFNNSAKSDSAKETQSGASSENGPEQIPDTVEKAEEPAAKEDYETPCASYSLSPFYGIWCAGTKELYDAQNHADILSQKGFHAQIFVTTDWSNLNSEQWYVVTAGTYATKEDANAALPDVQTAYPGAYVKYSGDYIGNGSSMPKAPEEQHNAAQEEHPSFYGIWCGASKDYGEAQSRADALAQEGFQAQVFVTTDWNNLNSEQWYVITAGVYTTQEEAAAALPSVQAVCADAYIKYSGEWQGS